MCRREGTGQLSNDGVVFALDMKTGTLLWNITGAGGVPIFLPQSNAVIVAGENGTVFAADATTGRVLWEQQGILPLARFMGPFVHDPQRGKYISNYRHTGVIYNKLQTRELFTTILVVSLNGTAAQRNCMYKYKVEMVQFFVVI